MKLTKNTFHTLRGAKNIYYRFTKPHILIFVLQKSIDEALLAENFKYAIFFYI